MYCMYVVPWIVKTLSAAPYILLCTYRSVKAWVESHFLFSRMDTDDYDGFFFFLKFKGR